MAGSSRWIMGAAVVVAGLSINTSAAMAKSSPVSAVIKHGIYKAIVVCPRWYGPVGGPAPLMDTPRKAVPRAGRKAPQPLYAPLVTCTVTFLKDAPAPLPKGKACSPGSVLTSARLPARVVRLSRSGARQEMRFASTCVLIETGFGGMAPQVSRHEPAARRHR